MPSLINHLYRFGDFTLDARSRGLRRGRNTVSLTPKAIEVLLLLVENAGQVVSKNRLMETVWANSFVEDSNLTQTIFMIRKALGETPDKRYILTAQGQGYRFLPEVKVDPEDNECNEHEGVPVRLRSGVGEWPTTRFEMERASATGSSFAQTRPATALRLNRLWLWASLLLLAGFIAWYISLRRSTTEVGPGRVVLAVLPLQNLTGDPNQEYLNDGLTEEMLTRLGSLDPQHLGVIARTSVMHYKGSSASLQQIAHELGVQYVVEGSVRRDHDRVRISVQLIKVRDQSHLWARQYDREMTGLLDVQGEVAQEVADEIQVTLGKPDLSTLRHTERETSSYEAYDLYLKGLYFWNKRLGGFQQAADCFQQAIDKDPNYARAYAGLAETYALMSTWLQGKPTDLMPKARAAAVKALQLDQSLSEGHVALALVAESYDYDWNTAEREFRRAIELNPNNSTAHEWYGEGLSWQGRFNEALAESDRARELDPVSLIVASDRGAVLFRARQYERAIDQYRAVLEMDPRYIHTFDYLLFSYLRLGRFNDALDEINKYIRPIAPYWAAGDEAIVYGQWGRTQKMKRALAMFEKYPMKTQVTGGLRLKVLANTGQNAKAISFLDYLLAARGHLVMTLKSEPFYDPLRSDPHFQEFVEAIERERAQNLSARGIAP